MSFIYRQRKDEDYAIDWEQPKKFCPIGEVAINSVVSFSDLCFASKWKVVSKSKDRVNICLVKFDCNDNKWFVFEFSIDVLDTSMCYVVEGF